MSCSITPSTGLKECGKSTPPTPQQIHRAELRQTTINNFYSLQIKMNQVMSYLQSKHLGNR